MTVWEQRIRNNEISSSSQWSTDPGGRQVSNVSHPHPSRRTNISEKGEGLLGDATFNLDPLASATYTLYYSPLRVQSHSGSVTFSAEAVGQFWYRLELRADPCPPVRCVTMRNCSSFNPNSSRPCFEVENVSILFVRAF